MTEVVILTDILSGPVGWGLLCCWIVLCWPMNNQRFAGEQLSDRMWAWWKGWPLLKAASENPSEPISKRPESTSVPLSAITPALIGNGMMTLGSVTGVDALALPAAMQAREVFPIGTECRMGPGGELEVDVKYFVPAE